tara:strand:+ start:20640 stop:21236 length:597 start_codon:yes stop_codon:yes gene_type:complete
MNRNFTTEIEKLQLIVEDNSWAQGFLDSLHSQIKNSRRSLSKRQIEVLDKIKGEYTAEAMAAKARWNEEYQNHHKTDAIVVATYYAHTGYFKHAADSILNDESYVPPLNLFNKMCKNKYAVKVLSAWHAPPKYPAGTAVMSRAGQSWALRDGGVVIGTDEPIISASKGCKRYKVLPYGAPRPVMCEEKYIKLFRKKIK